MLILTVTRISAGAFNIGVYARTHSCCDFSPIAYKSRPSLRWRQKLQCSEASRLLRNSRKRRRENDTRGAEPTQLLHSLRTILIGGFECGSRTTAWAEIRVASRAPFAEELIGCRSIASRSCVQRAACDRAPKRTPSLATHKVR